MNGKISSGQVMTSAVGISIALFPGLANFLILTTSKNASLLSILISFIIGFIPVLAIIYIGKHIKNESLLSFLKNKFKSFGYVLNAFLIALALFILFLGSWLLFDFIISQFLTRTSYYLIAITFSIIIAFILSKEIETTSRTIFILFILSMIIMVLIWICLVPYIKLDNLKPYIDVPLKNILKSSYIFLSFTTFPLIYTLNFKKITKDVKNFSRKIIVSYITSCLILAIFIFIIIAVYGIDLANLFTYPVYSLFKKVQAFGFIERIENVAAIIIIISFFTQFISILYYIKDNIKELFKIKSKKKIDILTYLLSLIIPITSIYYFKNFYSVPLIEKSPYIISTLAIIILIIFIRCLFIKKVKTS